MDYQLFLQLTLTGLAWGSIYALVAMSFVIIFKSTETFNFAQPEIMMLGAYVGFTLISVFELPFIAGFLLTLLVMAVMTAFMEILVVRPLVGEPMLSVVMITIGLAYIIQGAIGLIWGYEEFEYPSPFPSDPIMFGEVVISQAELYTIICTAILLIVFFLFFKFSSAGITLRATAEDTTAAFLMGINVKRVFTGSWVIAGLIATIAGTFLASFTFVDPKMNFLALKALPAIILGGMDSIHGAIIGGLIIGVTENLAGFYLEDYFGSGINEITAYVIVLVVMMIRPYGLFGHKEIERV